MSNNKSVLWSSKKRTNVNPDITLPVVNLREGRAHTVLISFFTHQESDSINSRVISNDN